tara:strand:+ start:24656 stop:25531 length:876 start_codon:yes stop_codon:yes gene_type:complete
MLDNFLKYVISEKRFSEHTCLAYKNDITQFIDFAGLSSNESFLEVEPNLIRGWMVRLLENEYSPNSVNRKISSLKTFFKWMLKENYISINPSQTITGPKSAKRLPSFVQEKDISTEGIQSLFADDFEGLRDQLMIEIFYQTGVRSSELINLKDKLVTNSYIKIIGKRNKERIIPISKELYELTLKYKEQRNNITLDKEFLFVLNSGKKLYPKFVYRRINNYLSRVTELEKKSPHVLRHTFATHMLNSGAGLEVLKELLGHANLSATQVYTHNSFAQLTSIYSQSHPRGHKK